MIKYVVSFLLGAFVGITLVCIVSACKEGK